MISITRLNEIESKLEGVSQQDLLDYISSNYLYELVQDVPLSDLFDSFNNIDFITYICDKYRCEIFEELDLDDPLLKDTVEG